MSKSKEMPECNSTSSIEELLDLEKCVSELEDHKSYEELKSIIASLSLENPLSDTLFLGKYAVFILENLIPWQKKIGDYFQTIFVICAVKAKQLIKQESTCNEVFDDIGNPLSVEFESFLHQKSKEKISFSVLKQLNSMYDIFPLPHCLGKQLLFMCTKLENNFKLPFITICHEISRKNHFLYGSYVKDKALNLKITNLGKVSSIENIPSLNVLKNAHLEGFTSTGNCIETAVFAHYEFLGCNNVDSSLVPVKNSCMEVECSWSDTHSVLESLPSELLSVIAKLKTVIGDEETGAFEKYKEIKLLKSLLSSLESGMMTWINPDLSTLIISEIEALIYEERSRIISKECFELPDIDLDHLENVISAERVPLSFPDKLWLILKNCSSFGQLIEALQYTYKLLAELNLTPPIVNNNDVSTISKDISSMFYQPITCPDLNTKKAAEMLLEIGVEKMRRDYFEFFIRLGLVPQELFNHFTEPKLLSKKAVTCLEKLHSVLELSLVCKKQLNLPKQILSDFARNSLKYYVSIPEVDLEHVFAFHIPTIYIRPVLDQMRPTIWELSLFSSDKNLLKQSSHRFVTTPTHDHICAPQNYHPRLMLKGASYVYLSDTLIENILPYAS